MGNHLVKQLSNEELTPVNIPSPQSRWRTIATFALSFDGYEYWGSFEKCAEIANGKRARSLTELRTCLFFEQRRWHHFGEAPDKESMKYIRGLVESIRAKVVAGDVD